MYGPRFRMLLIALLQLILLQARASGKLRKVHVNYPVELLHPIVGDHFIGSSKQDKLTCFSNRDYKFPTYFDTLLCMMGLRESCLSVWGSRPVILTVNGSVEFFKLHSLPPESNSFETLDVIANRWLEMTSFVSHNSVKEIKQIPCEPVVLCARSYDWNGDDSTFNISFRPGYVRGKDRELYYNKSLIHVVLLIMVSSAWLLPYVAALIVAALAYRFALGYIITISIFSVCIAMLTPFMLTKRNRYISQHYLKYFIHRSHAAETKDIIKKRMFFFQAVYFSSTLVCIGTASIHILYFYLGIDRQLKNTLLKITVGMAASWLTFSLCRSFEGFCRDWAWVVLCVGLNQMIESHINPYSRDVVFVLVLILSFLVNISLSKFIIKSSDWILTKYFPCGFDMSSLSLVSLVKARFTRKVQTQATLRSNSSSNIDLRREVSLNPKHISSSISNSQFNNNQSQTLSSIRSNGDILQLATNTIVDDIEQECETVGFEFEEELGIQQFCDNDRSPSEDIDLPQKSSHITIGQEYFLSIPIYSLPQVYIGDVAITIPFLSFDSKFFRNAFIGDASYSNEDSNFSYNVIVPVLKPLEFQMDLNFVTVFYANRFYQQFCNNESIRETLRGIILRHLLPSTQPFELDINLANHKIQFHLTIDLNHQSTTSIDETVEHDDCCDSLDMANTEVTKSNVKLSSKQSAAQVINVRELCQKCHSALSTSTEYLKSLSSVKISDVDIKTVSSPDRSQPVLFMQYAVRLNTILQALQVPTDDDDLVAEAHKLISSECGKPLPISQSSLFLILSGILGACGEFDYSALECIEVHTDMTIVNDESESADGDILKQEVVYSIQLQCANVTDGLVLKESYPDNQIRQYCETMKSDGLFFNMIFACLLLQYQYQQSLTKLLEVARKMI